MAEIKPAEVSAILRQELAGVKTQAELQEVGTVLEVGDGIARVYGLDNVQLGELVEFENGMRAIALNLEQDNVGLVLLGSSKGIREGSIVKRTKKIASIQAGEGLVGRVIDTMGQPIDGKGPITGELFEMPIERKAPGVIFRQPVNEPLQTGIKAVDAMIPIGRGQRELIIGDRQTGKSTVAIDTIINQKEFYEAGEPVFCIYVAIGQKGSTVAGIVNTLEKALKPVDLEKISKGVQFDEHRLSVDEVSYIESEPHTEVGIKLRTANVGVVKSIFEKFGYKVIKVDRVSFAGLTKKNLPRGNWRLLTKQEIINLKNI